MNYWRIGLWFVLSACIMLLPEIAAAQLAALEVNTSFAGGCSAGSAGNGVTLFTNHSSGPGRCLDDALFPGIFSKTVCTFEALLGEILANMFCAVSEAWQAPFYAMATLLMVGTGILFITGIVPFSFKDVTILVFKIGLIATFASNLDMALGLSYSFFINLTKGMTEIINQVMGMSADPFAKASHEMQQTTDFINSVRSTCSSFITSIVLFFLAPVIFMVMLGMVISYLMFFARAMYGFLFSLTMITFMIALMPIYVSFALFQTTRDLFDNWLRYIGSHCIQIFVVFAFIAFSAEVDVDLRNMMNEISSILVLNTKEIYLVGTIKIASFDYCTFCEPTLDTSSGVARIDISAGCGGRSPLSYTELMSNEPLMTYFFSRGGSVYMLLSVMENFLRITPDLAKSLSGSNLGYTVAGSSAGMGGAPPSGFIALTEQFQKGVTRGQHMAGAGSKTRLGGTLRRLSPYHRVAGGLTEGVMSVFVGEGQITDRRQMRKISKWERSQKAKATRLKSDASERIRNATTAFDIALKDEVKNQREANDRLGGATARMEDAKRAFSTAVDGNMKGNVTVAQVTRAKLVRDEAIATFGREEQLHQVTHDASRANTKKAQVKVSLAEKDLERSKELKKLTKKQIKLARKRQRKGDDSILHTLLVEKRDDGQTDKELYDNYRQQAIDIARAKEKSRNVMKDDDDPDITNPLLEEDMDEGEIEKKIEELKRKDGEKHKPSTSFDWHKLLVQNFDDNR